MKHTIQVITLISFLIASTLIAGCTTLADAKKAKGTGEKAIYNASFEELWDAIPNVVTSVGLEFVSANESDHSILAQRGVTAFSYGENVAIFVEVVTEGDKTSVEVVSRKSMQTNVFAPRWAKPIFEELDKRYDRS